MSLEQECDWRLTNLYNESHTWLTQAATNITRSSADADELVSDLYLYLHKKKNPKIFWGPTSYNLMYCYRNLQTRWISKRQKLHRYNHQECMSSFDDVNEEYDVEKDEMIMREFERVKVELKRLEQTNMFPQAKLFELYWFSDDKIMDVADKIHLSKSTVFNSIKKIRQHLKEVINNPFIDEE